MENEDVAHDERVKFDQQLNGYLRLREFGQLHGFWLDSKARLRRAASLLHKLGRKLVQMPRIPVVRVQHVHYIARLIDWFGWTGTPIYPMNIMFFPNAAPWLAIDNAANHHGVAIFRPNIGEDQQSTNELIAAHGLFIRFLEAVDVMQQVERLLIRDRHAFVSAGARLASEHCLPVMRADDVESVVALINEFGYDGIPQPIYPDAPVLLEQPNREEAQVILNLVNGRFHTAVMLLGGEELHLVAMALRKNDGRCLCFWGFNVALGLYNSCLVMLNLRCLGIVFDLDETLIVANTMCSSILQANTHESSYFCSLQITPACNLHLKSLRGGGKFVIASLQTISLSLSPLPISSTLTTAAVFSLSPQIVTLWWKRMAVVVLVEEKNKRRDLKDFELIKARSEGYMLTSGKTSYLCIGCNVPPLEDEEDKFSEQRKGGFCPLTPKRRSPSRYFLSTNKILNTSKGSITIELYKEVSPEGG
ncbi:RNA polymerase II C-terminal domain phosphatase-like 1 [Camellia lanceoleosa]|nr:RNA polymerase II C-terminal domain phosphatase-like 1 [Camellia lanceoleosa]